MSAATCPTTLPIDAADRDVGLLVDRNLDVRRNLELDQVRVTQGEHHLLAGVLGAVPEADDVEPPS